MMKFEVFRGENGQYFFHIKAGNGQRVAQSEGYTRKESAMGTIESIKKDAASAPVHDLTK